MAERFSVEELVINDSFIAYCFHANAADVEHWEGYIRMYPGEAAVIDQARDMVLNLSMMLQEHGEDASEHSSQYKLITNLYGEGPLSVAGRAERRVPSSRIWMKMTAAAAVLAVVLLLVLRKNDAGGGSRQTTETPARDATVVNTPNGQKKVFYLPDSSRVVLNAGSRLTVSKGFGDDNRIVSLYGEAYFDVRKQTRHPFLVRTAGYEVTVLGTVFNIKAYAEEKTTELDLISGKVQVSEVRGAGKWMVKPLQKLVLPNETGKTQASVNTRPVVRNLTFRGSDSIISETAWEQNRLEIVNETFGSMKGKLERWFNIKIVFSDDQVREYPFTGYFSNESIQEVLKAFQYSYPFNYNIKNDIVTISK